MKIPIIDISAIFTNDKEQIAILVNEVKLTMETIGFFMIKNHKVTSTTINDLWNSTREYFNQSVEIKSLIKMTPSYPYGYEASEILSQTFNDDKRKYSDMKETFQICLNYSGNKLPSTQEGIDKHISNYYDVILCTGFHFYNEIKEMEKIFYHPKKLLLKIGYPNFERMFSLKQKD